MNPREHDSEHAPQRNTPPLPLRLSQAGEARREQIRAALHQSLSRRARVRRATHASLAALALLGLTWLATRTTTSPAPQPATPFPIARSAPSSPPSFSHATPAVPDGAVTTRPPLAPPRVAIVSNDPSITTRLHLPSRPVRAQSLDDAQLLAELRPVRGEVGLIRLAGRVEIINASGTLKPARRTPDPDHVHLPASPSLVALRPVDPPRTPATTAS